MSENVMNIKVPTVTAFTIAGKGGRPLLTVHSDGRVEGSEEDAPEAAALFVREVKRMWGEPRTVEYGVRHEVTSRVTSWGDWNFLEGADPKDYPGFEIVSRTATEWEPLTPTPAGSES